MGGQDPTTKTVGESVEAQVTQTVANITTTLKAAGLGLSDVAWAQGYATRVAEASALEGTLDKAVTSPHGLVAVPRLPGPIRAELTFIATKPSTSGEMFGIATEERAHGVRRGSTYYVDARPADGDSIETAAKEAFKRLGYLLEVGRVGLRDVALVTVYLSDIADLPRMNAVFAETFPTDPPARITIVVQPQATERIRLTAIAAR